MKVFKFYCDLCNEQITEVECERIKFNKKNFDLCPKCLEEFREKVQKIINEMKVKKAGE